MSNTFRTLDDLCRIPSSVPTTRETADHIGEANEKVTADHAELARLAEAAKRVRRDAIGRLDGDDSHRIWFAFVDAVSNPTTVLSLLSEIAALRGVCDHANDHWKKTQAVWQEVLAATNCKDGGELVDLARRATQAERQRDEAVGLLRDVVCPGWTRQAWSDARAFLARLANQGADQ